MDSIRIQVRLPAEIAAELDAIADSLGLTRSGTLRYLIRDYVQQHGGAAAAPMGGTTTPPWEINDQDTLII